jgi:hypothetical protein
MRKISDKFINDLISGELHALQKLLLKDQTLSLCIRKDYVNVYYRGGNIIRITELKNGYKFVFNDNYCIDNNNLWKTFHSIGLSTLEDYIKCLPYLKREMDNWFSSHTKMEREIQQMVMRNNNIGVVSRKTDYVIVDVEYVNSTIKSRFDMVGINQNKNKLAIFEIKYGNQSTQGSAGLEKHILDIYDFYRSDFIKKLAVEAQSLYDQMVNLGLIDSKKSYSKIGEKNKFEYILIMGNYSDGMDSIIEEVNKAIKKNSDISQEICIRVAKANFMGYGLFEDNMIDINLKED